MGATFRLCSFLRLWNDLDHIRDSCGSPITRWYALDLSAGIDLESPTEQRWVFLA
jgi:hypothetical protein